MAGGKGAGRTVKAVSKYLALVLRHKPEAAGLVLDAGGWAPVADVLAAVQRRFGPFSRADLDALVRSSDKQRYAFDESGTRIRASQGHSVEVELGLAPVAPPLVLYHGTVRRFMPSILEAGLVKGRRQHVHLSADEETARTVGGRRPGETVILEVLACRMAAAGHSFFRSANGVWLADRVPPEFLRPVAGAPSGALGERGATLERTPPHPLFSYGTLRQPEVQRHLFGRTLEGAEDDLPGFRIERLRITDPAVIAASGSDDHPVLRRGTAGDRVAGTAFALSDEELRKADGYEVSDYVRIAAVLGSGRQAFVYVHRDDADG